MKERRQGMVMAPGVPTAAPVVEQRGGIAASGWFRRGGVVRMLTEVEAKRGRGVGVGCSRGFAAGSGSLSSAWAVARDEEREMSERSRNERRAWASGGARRRDAGRDGEGVVGPTVRLG